MVDSVVNSHDGHGSATTRATGHWSATTKATTGDE